MRGDTNARVDETPTIALETTTAAQDTGRENQEMASASDGRADKGIQTDHDVTAVVVPEAAPPEVEQQHTPDASTPVTKVTEPSATKVAAKTKATFDGLPNDLKLAVVEQISRPSDLRNVCLVNKELHELSVRFLYRTVCLDIGCKNDNKLTAFLNPKNIGLKYVRQLNLYLAQVKDPRNQIQQAHFATRMLLEFLPEDVLEEFSWCPWKPFDTDNLLLLYRRQRKLKGLEAMDLERDALPELKKRPKMQETMFSNARTLALYPAGRESLNLSGFYVSKLADRLEELIMHCDFYSSTTRLAIPPHELNDAATAPGLLMRTVFSHMLPFEKCTPFQHLTVLCLHKTNLRHAATTWCKIINFRQIQSLRLYRCPGVDSLFGELSKSTNLPDELKFLEVQHEDNKENEALMAIDGFLCLVSGLEVLAIDLDHVGSMLSAACVAKHGKTLDTLNIHCTIDMIVQPNNEHTFDELVWSVEDFDKICTACPGLEQLSCAWPTTFLLEEPTPEWKAFETSCARLRNMVTLQITTWPFTRPKIGPLPRFAYEQNLQSLAQRGFELAAGLHPSQTSIPPPPPDVVEDDSDDEQAEADTTETVGASAAPGSSSPAKLRIIAFGVSDKIYERQDSTHQLLYLRSTCLDAEGREQPFATPLGWCVRQFIEPRSDVLEFMLHRVGSSPPCLDWKGGSGMDGWRLGA